MWWFAALACIAPSDPEGLDTARSADPEPGPDPCLDVTVEPPPPSERLLGSIDPDAAGDVVVLLDMSQSTFFPRVNDYLGRSVVSFVEAWRDRQAEDEANGLLAEGAAARSQLGVLAFASEPVWWIPMHRRDDPESALLQPASLDWGTPNAVPHPTDEAYNEACIERFKRYGLGWDGWEQHPTRPDLCALGDLSRGGGAIREATDALLANGRSANEVIVMVASGALTDGFMAPYVDPGGQFWGVAVSDPRTCPSINDIGPGGGGFRFEQDPENLEEVMLSIESLIAGDG